MNLLATFNANDKQYAIFVKQHQICYGYFDGERISEDLTAEDIKLCDSVKNKIMISEDIRNHIKCGTIDYNEKIFQIIFDKISQRKFAYRIDRSRYKFPTVEEYIYLDKFLNPVIYNSRENNCEIAKIVLSAGLSITLVLSSYLLCNEELFNHAFNYVNEKIDFVQMFDSVSGRNDGEKFNCEEAIGLVNSNPNLTEEEKQFLREEIDKLADNSEIINPNYMLKRLGDVDFEYISSSKVKTSNSFDGKNVTLGSYDFLTNKVILVGKNITSSKVSSHEIQHLFFSPILCPLGNSIQEAMVTIVDTENNNEDLSLDKGAYKYERNMVYLLIELLGADVFKEYYYGGGNIYVLVDALTQIIDDYDKAYSIIGEIDNIRAKIDIAVERNNGLFSNELVGQAMQEFYSRFNEYWQAKYNEEIYPYDAAGIYMYFYDNNKFNIQGPLKELYDTALEKIDESNRNNMRSYGFNVIPKSYFIDNKAKNIVYVEYYYGIGESITCVESEAYEYNGDLIIK